MKKSLINLIIVVLMVTFVITLIPNKVSAIQNRKTVLVIQSYHNGYKWTDDIMSGINSILNTSDLEIDIDVEYMDTLSNHGQEYTSMLKELYKKKYGNKKLDAVLCADDNAYNFVVNSGQTIFSDTTPIVFCGVNYFENSAIKDNKMVTGVVENFDIAKNLDLILKLHPETKNVYIINDKTTTGEAINKKTNEVIAARKDKLNYINLQGRNMEEILESVKKPLKDSLILFLIFFEDESGQKFTYSEGVKLISENSTIPIYGVWEFSLGHGIIGGMLTSGYYQGKTAAETVIRILKGEAPSDITVIDENTNSYMFDYNEMKRFNIKTSDIPADSYIINRANESKKQVLVLNSYHHEMQWTSDIVSGIKSVLQDDKYDVHFDYMDNKSNYSVEYQEKIEDLLKYKYKNKKVDIIITSDNDAYDFMGRYHSKLFPSIPLIFCGLNYYSPTIVMDNTTGVIEAIDVKKTLDIALHQNPYTKNIVVINDRTLTGLANEKLLNSVIPTMNNKVNFIFYEDMSMVEIQKMVSELENDTLVYLFSFNKDKHNNIFSYEESAELISSKSNVPVYGPWDFYLGHGIVGGMLANGQGQGEMAAEMAKQVLDGKNIKDIAIIEGITNKYMFDYNVLKKFGISVASLPEESIVINTPEKLPWDKSRMMVLLSLTAVIIIILFLLNYRKNHIIKNNTMTIKELEISASTDGLTLLFNRVAGLKSLDEHINLSNQLGKNLIICFIDLNNLKNVNDRFGHNEGDNYLLTTTRVIRESLNQDAILFRYGGDEFIVLFPNMTLDGAKEILINITGKLEEYSIYNCKINKCRYRLSLSYGFSEYISGSNVEVGELIRNADEEMYKCKKLIKEKEAKDKE